jgi:hypothetical protein
MFSVTDKYIYVYGAGLLENMLVWSDDKKYRQGHIGSHVSIGLKNNMIDIHSTLYALKVQEQERKQHVICSTSKKVYYSVRTTNKNKLMRISGGKQSGDIADVVWDEILCVMKHGKFVDSLITIGGGKSSISSTPYRKIIKKKKTMFSLLEMEYKKEKTTTKNDMNTIKVHLDEIYNFIESSSRTRNVHNKPYGLISISYVPKNQYKSFARKLQSSLDDRFQTVLVSDHHAKLSVLMVHVFLFE